MYYICCLEIIIHKMYCMKKLIMLRLLTYALMVAVPFWSSSCKKDSDESVTPVSVEGSWKLTSIKANPAIDGGPFGKIDDFFAFFKALGAGPCLEETTITFNKNGTTTGNNPQSCQNSEEVSDIVGANNGGQWKLDSNKLTLTDPDGTSSVYDVTFNGDTMQWSQLTEFEDGNGQPTKTTVTIGLKRA